MKLIMRLLFVTIMVLSACNSVSEKPAPVVITGELENFEGKEVALLIMGEVIGKSMVVIPVKDGKFTTEVALNGPKLAVMTGGESFYSLVYLKPGATTNFKIDANNKMNGVQALSADKEDQNKLPAIMKSLMGLSIFSHPEWYAMSTEELDGVFEKYDAEFKGIEASLSDAYLKKWVLFNYQFEKIKTKASYVSTLQDADAQKRFKTFMPNVSFNKVIPPNDYANVNDFDFDNQMMLDIASDIEMDLGGFLRMKLTLNNVKVDNNDWTGTYLKMLEEITYQPLYDAFAFQAYRKYGRPDENWGAYMEKVSMKISDTSMVAELKSIRAKSIEKEERIKKITSAPVPTFTMETIDGKKKTIADFKGKFVLLDMWATWCGPCKMEIPHLQKKEEKYHDKVAFVSLSFDKKKQTWVDFVKKEKLTGIQVIAGENYDNFQNHYMITGFPTFILLGKDGKVINQSFLRPSSPGFDSFLEAMMKQHN